MKDNNTDIQKSRKNKIKIISIITAVVLLIAISVTFVCLNLTLVETKVTMLLMPNSLTTAFDGKEVTFYARENKNFNPKTDASQPLSAFEFYYYDDNGKEVNLGYDGLYKTKTQDIMPSFLFLIKTNERVNNIKNALPKIVVVLIFIFIIVLIVLWYKSWVKRQDMEKKKKYNKR